MKARTSSIISRKRIVKSHACVLLSGGVESGVLLADALNRRGRVTPVYVAAGLRWESQEFFWIKKFLRRLKRKNLSPLVILRVPAAAIYGRHWSLPGGRQAWGQRVPGARTRDEAVRLPGRNVMLCSLVACYAAVHRASAVKIGVLKRNPFGDGSRNFFKKLSRVLSIGLEAPIVIEAPFAHLEKEAVIRLGLKLAVPFELTFSCINPRGMRHCGRCNKCAERQKAFKKITHPGRRPKGSLGTSLASAI